MARKGCKIVSSEYNPQINLGGEQLPCKIQITLNEGLDKISVWQKSVSYLETVFNIHQSTITSSKQSHLEVYLFKQFKEICLSPLQRLNLLNNVVQHSIKVVKYWEFNICYRVAYENLCTCWAFKNLAFMLGACEDK